MNQRWCRASVLAMALVFTASAKADVVFYTNLANWQSAAGTPSFTEDFSGFATDTSFRTAPVGLNGMTIRQEGVDAAFRNQVDVAPLEFSTGNGTNSGSLFTNAPEGPAAGTQVRITFNALNQAFGLESWEGNSGEGAVMEVYSGTTLLGSQALTDASGAFLGYVLTNGDTATSVRFRSDRLNGGQGGEGFYIDNLAGVTAAAIPEPGPLLLSGIGLVVFAATSLKKRRGKTPTS